MRKVLVIGATSAIATATARLMAQQGDSLFLVARNQERLGSLTKDLDLRGAGQVSHFVLDMNDFSRHQEMIDAAIAAMGGIDVTLIAHGTLCDQKACERDAELTVKEFNTNAVSTIALLTLLAGYFEQQRRGTIAVISSVAGDRGRQSNYVYGAAKGAVTIFLQGLRNRLHNSGVQVLTIKPGFVDTPMTADLKKGFLWAQPDDVAGGIVKAIEKGNDQVYLPGFWKHIMFVIKAVPEPFFKKLKL